MKSLKKEKIDCRQTELCELTITWSHRSIISQKLSEATVLITGLSTQLKEEALKKSTLCIWKRLNGQNN